jgi:hypothetical protein
MAQTAGGPRDSYGSSRMDINTGEQQKLMMLRSTGSSEASNRGACANGANRVTQI